MSEVIGIDLGGTKIDAAVLSEGGAVLFEKRLPTPDTYDAILAAIAGLVADAAHATGSHAPVGIGAPGSASPRTGLWRNANILVSNNKPLARDLEAAIGRPVRLENDANCFALSEAHDGAGKGRSLVACLTIGTALGGGLVIDGRIRKGRNNEAAEFGHTPMPWPNESEWPLLPCFCGKKGCVEQYVSGTGLARDYQRATGNAVKGPEIVARARSGETEAQAALARLADRLARLLAALVDTLDPDIFVIGGGLSHIPELLGDLGARAARYTFSREADIAVARAAHGEKSGVRGAARLWAPLFPSPPTGEREGPGASAPGG